MTWPVIKSDLGCCATPDIGSNWAYGFGGESIDAPDCCVLRVDNLHCVSCGTQYEIDTEQPIYKVQRDALAIRIVPVKRKPS